MGYDAFEVCEAREGGFPDYEGGVVTREFLRKLADYLEPDEELDIQTVGYTKCRLPVLAKRYVVREDEVLMPTSVDSNRSTSSCWPSGTVDSGIDDYPAKYGSFDVYSNQFRMRSSVNI